MTTHAYNALATAIDGAARSQLDDYSRQVWRAHGAGIVADDQAQQLQELIQQRRQPVARFTTMVVKAESVPRYFIQRSPEQRSPDRRASIGRRREHTATGPLPPHLARHYTYGQVAVLRIVADEWLAHGACDRSLNELAARAGVCHSLAKQAIKYAERDGLVTVLRRPRSGRKHLTNIIRIIRAEWLDWLAKGRRKAYAVGACYRAKPIFAAASQERAGARGVQNNPPRSQHFRNGRSNPVDNTVEKENRTGAGRA
jgi:hypothetical protein